MKIFITRDPIGSVRLYVTREGFGGKVMIAKPVTLEFEEVDQTVSQDGTLFVHGVVANQFMQSLADALAGQQVKTENDHKIEGVLEATKAHLTDMRQLVFEPRQLKILEEK